MPDPGALLRQRLALLAVALAPDVREVTEQAALILGDEARSAEVCRDGHSADDALDGLRGF